MTAIGDAAIVAAVIMDIIQMYKDNGTIVDLDSLAEAIRNEQARQDKVNKTLGIE